MQDLLNPFFFVAVLEQTENNYREKPEINLFSRYKKARAGKPKLKPATFQVGDEIVT